MLDTYIVLVVDVSEGSEQYGAQQYDGVCDRQALQQDGGGEAGSLAAEHDARQDVADDAENRQRHGDRRLAHEPTNMMIYKVISLFINQANSKLKRVNQIYETGVFVILCPLKLAKTHFGFACGLPQQPVR